MLLHVVRLALDALANVAVDDILRLADLHHHGFPAHALFAHFRERLVGLAQGLVGAGQAGFAHGQGIGGFAAAGFGHFELIHERGAVFLDFRRTSRQFRDLGFAGSETFAQGLILTQRFFTARGPAAFVVGEGGDAPGAVFGLAGEAVVGGAGVHEALAQLAEAALLAFGFGAQRHAVAQFGQALAGQLDLRHGFVDFVLQLGAAFFQARDAVLQRGHFLAQVTQRIARPVALHFGFAGGDARTLFSRLRVGDGLLGGVHGGFGFVQHRA